jgi:hypothetical protein
MKFTKSEVHYESPAKGMDHCSQCVHFQSSEKHCDIVKGLIQPEDWCKKFQEKSMEEKKKKHHGFTHSHIEHHKDGSHTVHHIHEEGPHKDIKHAVADLDGVHDSMEDHVGTPNPGEAAADTGDHGIPAGIAAGAGIPAPTPGPAGM